MEEINAFVGHGFDETDMQVVQPFLNHLDTFTLAHPSFSWTHARQPEPRDVGEKVLANFEGKNVLIAICTRKECVAKIEDVKRIPLLSQVSVPVGKLEWKTSDWVIQEIGVAIGRGMNIIILLEDGVRTPGTLQGNIERISFSSREQSRAFDALDRMLLSLEPRLQAVVGASSSPQPEKRLPKTHTWEEPKPDWFFENYEFAAWWIIINGNDVSEKLKVIENALLASPLATPDNLISWNGIIQRIKIEHAKDGDFDALKKLAVDNPNNHSLLESLARAYIHYQDYDMAAKTSEQEADASSETNVKLAALTRAAVNHKKNKNYISASNDIEKMRGLVHDVNSEISFLNGIIAIYDDNDIESICCSERILELNATNTDMRFNLGLLYQNRAAQHAGLSLYHYLKIPENLMTAMGWNNLGVAYAQNRSSALAVKSYKKAKEQNITLAMSNLANKLIDAGFLDEARELCEQARSLPNYDKRVDDAVVRLKEVEENEKNKTEEAIVKSLPISRFYALAGEALSKAYGSILGQWQHEKCVVTFKYEDGKIIGRGTYQTKNEHLGLFSLSSILIDRHITYEVTQAGNFLKGIYKDERNGLSISSLLMGNNTPDITMVLSVDGSTISVLEERYADRHIYKLQKIMQIPNMILNA